MQTTVSGADDPSPRVRAGTRRWSRWIAMAIVSTAIGCYYLWAVRAAGNRFVWKSDLGGYYDFLGRAFASGHLYLPIQPRAELLALPDPWDPSVGQALKWHDMVLFQRRYYLYYGAAPAVLLFAPWRLITGHDLPESFALFLLCFAGYLFSVGALFEVLELAGARSGPFLLSLMLLALGICQCVPYLLNRPFVYEVAIGGGYLFISAALFFSARGVRAHSRASWLAAGLMFGGAVASRPHLALAGAIALAGLGIALVRARGAARAPISRETAALAAGFTVVGMALAAYNYERFGNPLEFGVKYQLAYAPGQNDIGLGVRNLLPGLYYMLLCPPSVSLVFPWVRMVRRFPFDSAERHPLPPLYFLEATVGALWVAPFLLGALCVPRAPPRMILWMAAVSALAILLFLMSTHLATHRYEVDFVPLAVFASTANLGILIHRTAGRNRILLEALFLVLVLYSAIANLSLGIAGPYDDILKARPQSYVRIARWFSPIEEYRPMLNPDIDVALAVEFAPAPPGDCEPIVTMGLSHYRHFIAAEHTAAGGLRLVSQSAGLSMARDMPDAGGKPVRIGVGYSPASRTIITTLNGAEFLVHPVPLLVTAPAQVAAGENRTDFGRIARRFRGRIRVLSKTVREPR